MQIIHLVLGKANPNRMNGVNKVAHQLASTQAAMGLKTQIWGIAQNTQHDYPIRNFETRLFLQKQRKLFLDPILTKALRQLQKPTIIHLHGAFIPEFYHISKILAKKHIPFIYTPHGSFAPGALQKSKWKKRFYIRWFESFILNQASYIQALGHTEYAELQKYTSSKNIMLLPNGQNLQEIPSIKTKNRKNFPILGFCGRIDKYHKGLDLLFEGFLKFKKNGGAGRLELIGGGRDLETLRNFANQHHLTDEIIFHGPQYGQDKFERLAQMDVFLHTSRMEGFPTAVLEAAAMHIPCIVSKATNVDTYISKHSAGWVLEKNTPKHICETLHELEKAFRDEKLTLYRNNARSMVQSEFSWEHITTQLLQHYQRAI